MAPKKNWEKKTENNEHPLRHETLEKKTEKCALFRTPCRNLFHWRTTKERIKRNKKNQKKGAKKKEKTDHVAHVLGLAHVQRTSLRRNAEAVGAVRASPLHAADH